LILIAMLPYAHRISNETILEHIMLAFHNDSAIKTKYIERVMAHQLADEIEKGFYWQKGRGCAIGCTIHGFEHRRYEVELGIPRLLAKLEDGIFEGLPLERAKLWPAEFLNAINIGADLSGIWPKFASWLLTDSDHGVIKFAKNQEQKDIIQKISDYYSKHSEITQQEWIDIRRAATAATGATAAYADAAAYTADAAYAAATGATAAYADAAAYTADAAYAAATGATAAYADAAAYTADAASYAAADTAAYADAAAYTTDAASYAAADTAAYADAASYAAADTAAYAAYAGASAAADAGAYAGASAAAATARQQARVIQADKLLELLKMELKNA
jgi:hypothetical protein